MNISKRGGTNMSERRRINTSERYIKSQRSDTHLITHSRRSLSLPPSGNRYDMKNCIVLVWINAAAAAAYELG